MQAVSTRWGKIVTAACLAALLAAASLVAFAPQPAHAASTNTKACKAYKKILSKTTMKWATGDSIKTKLLRFSCQDINKDGVMDLVVYNPRGADATGRYRIYTYANGKAKKVGQYTDLVVCPNNNYYADTHTNTGHAYYKYYRLGKNGKVIKLAAYEEAPMEHPGYEGGELDTTYEGNIAIYKYNFKVNGKLASAAKTRSVIQSLEQGAKKITFLKNTASNRAKHLKAPTAPLKLSATSKTLAPGKTFTLKVKNVGKKSVTWSSSNKKVATVSKTGKVKAKKSGKATITAKVGSKKLTCKVTVRSSAKQKALASLNGWWHTGRHPGYYVCIKNGRMYRFSAKLDEDYSVIGYSTSNVNKSKLSLTRAKRAPIGDGSAYLIKVDGKVWYCYNDNDHKTLSSWDGTTYSGSSSLDRVNASEVPSNLKKYMKKR